MNIDTVSYRKDVKHPQRWGYQSRGNAVPSSVIIHTTNNRRATRFETEAAFLRDSAAVSAHFLLSKTGQIVQLLDPARWQAWHAGNTRAAFLNAKSIGIEHHVSVNEPWTDEQHAACTWLVRDLMRRFSIPVAMVETHRAVALPIGRKSDPAGWPDAAFYAWRGTLTAAPSPAPACPAPARVTPDSLLLWEPRATPDQCVAWLTRGKTGEYTKADVQAIVKLYYQHATGIDPLLAIAQMAHETGSLSSYWSARPRRNPAGLGVSGAKGAGLLFASWADAVPAHVGRLLAYALPADTGTAAQQACIRAALALRPLPIAYRGTAARLGGLDGRWAVPGFGYSQRIAEIANAIAGVQA